MAESEVVRFRQKIKEISSDIADQPTLRLNVQAIRSAITFQTFLDKHQLAALTVAQTCQVRYLTVWRIAHGYAVLPTQATLVRAALEDLTGTPYPAPIYTHSEHPWRSVW